MDKQFGYFVECKRKEKKINLRKLAELIGIAPAYMSDIEKGNRYPPDKEKLYKIVAALELDETDTCKLFDLAALAKDNSVSPDLPEYIMGNEKLRIALRMARDQKAGDDDWMKVIKMLESKVDGQN